MSKNVVWNSFNQGLLKIWNKARLKPEDRLISFKNVSGAFREALDESVDRAQSDPTSISWAALDPGKIDRIVESLNDSGADWLYEFENTYGLVGNEAMAAVILKASSLVNIENGEELDFDKDFKYFSFAGVLKSEMNTWSILPDKNTKDQNIEPMVGYEGSASNDKISDFVCSVVEKINIEHLNFSNGKELSSIDRGAINDFIHDTVNGLVAKSADLNSLALTPGKGDKFSELLAEIVSDNIKLSFDENNKLEIGFNTHQASELVNKVLSSHHRDR